jgi:orotate phosphoribosyltransferase
MDQARRQLLKLLKEKSFRYSPDKPFKLVSGRESPYYIDCRPTTHNAQGLALIGEIFFDLIRGLKVDAIGGLTMGADPLAHATALTSYLKGAPINAFSVRQRPKEHGAGGLLVGDVTPGDRAVVVEDVVTTGGSALKAVAAARDFGLTVVKVLILVDRQEGGKEAVAKEVPEVEAVFTISDLR